MIRTNYTLHYSCYLCASCSSVVVLAELQYARLPHGLSEPSNSAALENFEERSDLFQYYERALTLGKSDSPYVLL